MKSSLGGLFAQTYVFSDLSPGVTVLFGRPDPACPIVHLLDDLFHLNRAFYVARRLDVVGSRKLLQFTSRRYEFDRFLPSAFLLKRTIEPMMKDSKQVCVQINDTWPAAVAPLYGFRNRLKNAFPNLGR